jgi:phosphoribosylformylglycinamidine synthase
MFNATSDQDQSISHRKAFFVCAVQSNSPLSISRIHTVTQTYQAQVYVTLRPSVLDPAGTAVQSGLAQLGFDGVDRLRIGKYIELTLEAEDEAIASQQIDAMCDRLLANTTIENYRFEIKALSPNAAEAVGA